MTTVLRITPRALCDRQVLFHGAIILACNLNLKSLPEGSAANHSLLITTIEDSTLTVSFLASLSVILHLLICLSVTFSLHSVM